MKYRVILFDQTDLFGKRIGGAEMFVKGFIKYAPSNWNISFIGTTIDPVKRPLNQWVQVSFGGRDISYMAVVLEEDENQKSVIPLSLQYSLALGRRKIDVRNSILFFNRIEHSIAFKSAFCLKFVMVHHDIEGQILRRNGSEMLWSKIPFLYKLFEQHALQGIDHLYTVSDNSLRYYHSHYPSQKEKFSFLPTWLDPEIFSPTSMDKRDIRRADIFRKYQLNKEAKWILFVGRLQEVKAPERLIDVFKEYHDMEPDSILLVVGDGNLRHKMLGKLARYGLTESLVHISYLPQTQLVDFYRASDAMLVVSNYEGMPISVLEALGCGLPVVSTRVGEVPRVVKNGFSGEIIDSFDAGDIAVALRKVLTAPDIYKQANCITSIGDFVPTKVLEPVFRKMVDMLVGKLKC